jgi:hypothetical protein
MLQATPENCRHCPHRGITDEQNPSQTDERKAILYKTYMV